jgi:Methyltransferase FkbM domain
MDPQSLTVYKSPFKKVRLGKHYDGGYVICDIPDIQYSIALGCGISGDISFEEELCEKYKNLKCLGYDGTISGIKISNPNISFIKKNISSSNSDTTTNLCDIIDENDNIFLKMDIEGAEIDWLGSLTDEQLNKFSQIAIEFHYPFSNRENSVFQKLNKNHKLVHLHGNNFAGARMHNNVLIPNVFECTYINKKYNTNDGADEWSLNDEPLPCSIDMPNYSIKGDIPLNHAPFVHKI